MCADGSYIVLVSSLLQFRHLLQWKIQQSQHPTKVTLGTSRITSRSVDTRLHLMVAKH